jgi:hypothetical protein
MSVDQFAEAIARRTDRRVFLRRAATSVFAFSAAAAVAGLRAPLARADGPCPDPGEAGHCLPPGGVYCTSYDANLCSTAECPSSGSWTCSVDKTFRWPSTGCWCTKTTYYRCGLVGSYYGYYKCCDCKCQLGSGGKVSCGCSEFVKLCPPCCDAEGNPFVMECC